MNGKMTALGVRSIRPALMLLGVGILFLGATPNIALGDCGDFAIRDQNISHSINAIGGVDHTSAAQKQRIHRPKEYKITD